MRSTCSSTRIATGRPTSSSSPRTRASCSTGRRQRPGARHRRRPVRRRASSTSGRSARRPTVPRSSSTPRPVTSALTDGSGPIDYAIDTFSLEGFGDDATSGCAGLRSVPARGLAGRLHRPRPWRPAHLPVTVDLAQFGTAPALGWMIVTMDDANGGRQADLVSLADVGSKILSPRPPRIPGRLSGAEPAIITRPGSSTRVSSSFVRSLPDAGGAAASAARPQEPTRRRPGSGRRGRLVAATRRRDRTTASAIAAR